MAHPPLGDYPTRMNSVPQPQPQPGNPAFPTGTQHRSIHSTAAAAQWRGLSIPRESVKSNLSYSGAACTTAQLFGFRSRRSGHACSTFSEWGVERADTYPLSLMEPTFAHGPLTPPVAGVSSARGCMEDASGAVRFVNDELKGKMPDAILYLVHGARMLEARDTTGYTGSLSTSTTHVSLLIDDRAVLERCFVLGARLPLPLPCSAPLTPLSDPSPRSCIPPPVPPSQPRHPPRSSSYSPTASGAQHSHALAPRTSWSNLRGHALAGRLETRPRVGRDGLPREQADIARQAVVVAGARKGGRSCSMRRGRCLQVKVWCWRRLDVERICRPPNELRAPPPASPAGTHLDEFRAHHPDEYIGVYLHSPGYKALQALRSLKHLSKKLIMPTSLRFPSCASADTVYTGGDMETAVATVFKELEHEVDVVLSTITTLASGTQKPLVNAAKLAAVKLFVPSVTDPQPMVTQRPRVPLERRVRLQVRILLIHIPFDGFVAHILTTAPPSELEDRILLEGARSTLNDLAPLFGTSVDHVDRLTGETGEFQTALQIFMDAGAGSTSWDGLKKVEGTGSSAAGSANAL
ncbi:hypothetical protein B0H14DRAFT_3497082 [Mycena olivaceomarginata]|nr:hypothetical protein B0H14DRAFT_3497082 [Mycena olivaceomarginata]